MIRYHDISGQQFDHLTVLWPEGRIVSSGQTKIVYLCACDCGQIKHTVRRDNLTNGLIRSCGCSHVDANVRHGHARVGQKVQTGYNSYVGARQRCLNPKSPAYPNYGGRGVEFRFSSFEEWHDELGYKPSPTHSVDRINNNGHYERGNVRWATKSEQNRNQRRWQK